MDFRLVQDVTELEQFSGGFPEGGADRYVFGFDARQAVNFSVQPMNAQCPEGIVLEILPRASKPTGPTSDGPQWMS